MSSCLPWCKMRGVWKVAALVIAIVCLRKFSAANLILPEGMKQDTYCETCSTALKAFVDANAKGAALRSACNSKNLERFCSKKQSLDGVRTTCTHLLKLHGKALSKEISVKKGDELEEWLCINKSYACLGVNRSGKANFGKNSKKEMEMIRDYIKKNKDRVRVPHPHLYNDEL